jgi:putative spermidine/putrescine transport system ATP-binding protein
VSMVRLTGVSKHYGAVTAVAGIDLEIAKGEFVTLLGPSGSGKTTLLNLIAGTVAPTSGRIWIHDRDVTETPSSGRGLGMVFQNYALFPHMTIFENIAFPLRVRRLGKAELRRKVAEVLELVRLPDVQERKPKELSGGQQQRIAIARCLVYDPSLILMDEPLGALDKKLRDQMQLEIKRLHASLGITILYVTHDQEEALVMSDRICLMNGGRIEQLGTADDLYFRPASVFAADFLGESNLLEAELVAGPESGGVLRTPVGLVVREAPADVPPSGRVALMIRPESLHVLADGESAPNTLDGVLEDVVFVGGVTKFFIRTGDGSLVIMKQLTSGPARGFTRGAPLRVGWRRDDMRVLRAKVA